MFCEEQFQLWKYNYLVSCQTTKVLCNNIERVFFFILRSIKTTGAKMHYFAAYFPPSGITSASATVRFPFVVCKPRCVHDVWTNNARNTSKNTVEQKHNNSDETSGSLYEDRQTLAKILENKSRINLIILVPSVLEIK